MLETDETFLQKKSARLIRNLAVVGLSLCALAVILYGLTRGNWINGLLAGVALAMALLPEEIPGSAYGLSRPRRLAHVPEKRSDATHASHRDARRGHDSVR